MRNLTHLSYDCKSKLVIGASTSFLVFARISDANVQDKDRVTDRATIAW